MDYPNCFVMAHRSILYTHFSVHGTYQRRLNRQPQYDHVVEGAVIEEGLEHARHEQGRRVRVAEPGGARGGPGVVTWLDYTDNLPEGR